MPLTLVTRRMRYGLTWRGWLVLVLGVAGVSAGVLRGVYPFLAVTERISSDVLVVEGWVPDYAIQAARAEYAGQETRVVFATGGPLLHSESSRYQHHTVAEYGARRLQLAGVPPTRVHSVPAPRVSRDRTYASAVALREWLQTYGQHADRLNIVTTDVHARRTRLLFERAFGPDVAIGVIAVPSPDYPPGEWWRCSEGVRDVLSESIAYLYARLFFFPADPAHEPALTAAS